MDDPFPRSLPTYEPPRIYDPTLPHTGEDDSLDFFDPNESFNSAPPMFNDDNRHNTDFSSTKPYKSSEQNTRNQSGLPAAPWSQSPESSSGSDSSNQHKRASSSDSSATGDVHMKQTSTANGILIGADNIDDETSNKLMESHFDFDSAASSPIPRLADMKPSIKIPSGIRMPYRSGGPGGMVNPYHSSSSVSNGSPEVPVQQSTLKNDHIDWSAASEVPPQVLSPSNFILNNPTTTGAWPFSAGLNNFDTPTLAQRSPFQQSTMTLPFQPAPAVTAPAYPQPPPTLHVAPLPLKSRVETQSNVKLTIDPLPPHVTKLHLQPYTISKSKLMAKPTPERTPDMFELYTTLVCTSAMQNREKYDRAFNRAAGTYTPAEKPEGRRSSAGDADSPDDDENKPLNGGPVNICLGCIERERKRAARKKTKNVEEEELWLKDEAKRIVVFNTHEVKDWQTPSNAKTTDGNNRNMPAPVKEESFSINAGQVDIPMRIACYCRHHEEKMGFRVIFTIRDHQNNFVAQTVSNSIIITDDHKTHPTPNSLPNPPMVYSESTQLSGTTAFPQASNGNSGMTPFTRNAFSTTDLQGMQQQLTNARLNCQPKPFAVPLDSSQTTSTTLTPRNLSRPASPTFPSGQQNKRRKASGSGRIRSDLMMTKMSSGSNSSPGPAISSVSPTTQHPNMNSINGPTFSPTYTSHRYHIPSGAPQNLTNPSTPSTADGSYLTNIGNMPKSQSFDNLQHFQDVFSNPTSAHNSRAPSPPSDQQYGDFSQANGLPQTAGVPPNHAQLVTNSLQVLHGTTNNLRPPVIHELTPAEGSKSGGFKVTCLGSGFTQGLEVMFGDAVATTTTYWGETTLVCLVPPARQAGTVMVTLKNMQGQHIPPPQNRPTYFKYVDDDQSELMRQMFAVLGRDPSAQGNIDPADFTRYIMRYGQNISPSTSSNQSAGNYRQAAVLDSAVTSEILELSMLKCLECIDMDDSPRQANLNYCGRNGQSMLHLCASLGFYRMVAGLLARGANPDIRDNNGMSPMHMASLYDQIRVIRKLRAAGGDPTIRSLNGFTPADMASTQEAQDASSVLEHRVRSRSLVNTPASNLSRTASIISHVSSTGESPIFSRRTTFGMDDLDVHHNAPIKSAHIRPRSRRASFGTPEANMTNKESLGPNVTELATQSALAAWRDQLSAQIQQVQQTVHRALPPLPNLPDYQGHPVVRRISSLVPQRNTPTPGARSDTGNGKDNDYHWWELLTGASSAPPAYEDIYPDKLRAQPDEKKAGLMRAASEALMDQKCETMFDAASSTSFIETVNIGKKNLTQQEQDRLRAAHAQKIKRLRSDRNLFFIWIPLLIFVVVSMLKDRIPQLIFAARQTYSYINRLLPARVEESL